MDGLLTPQERIVSRCSSRGDCICGVRTGDAALASSAELAVAVGVGAVRGGCEGVATDPARASIDLSRTIVGVA